MGMYYEVPDQEWRRMCGLPYDEHRRLAQLSQDLQKDSTETNREQEAR